MLDSEGHETALKLLAPDTCEGLISIHSEEPMDHLNVLSIKGKNKATTFLPLKQSSGGLVQYVMDRNSICLTTDQARYIYKKGCLVNVEMIKQEIEEKLDKDNELG